MDVRLRDVRRPCCFWCLQLFLLAWLALPSFAQVGPFAPSLLDLSVGHPEGTNPAPFCGSLDGLFAADSGYNVTAATSASITSHVEWDWKLADGSTYSRTVNPYTKPGVYYSPGLGGFSLHYDFNDPSDLAMTPSGLTLFIYGQNGQDKVNLQYPSPYVLGVTLFRVKTQSGAPIPSNTVLTMDNYFGPTRTWTVDPTRQQAIIGEGLYITPDAPYPAGMGTDTYAYHVTAPGYATTYQGNYMAGTSYPGQTINIVLVPSGQTPPVPTSAPTTTTDNPDQPPSTSTGSSGFGDFFTTFWDKLQKFFYDPDLMKSDLADARKNANDLFTYGPLGLPGQFKQQADYAASLFSHTAASDPNYWVFPTFSQLPGLPYGASLPDDIDKNQTFAPTYDQSLVSQFNVLSASNYGLDLHPYAGFIIFGRWFFLAVIWFVFLRSTVDRFSPEVRI